MSDSQQKSNDFTNADIFASHVQIEPEYVIENFSSFLSSFTADSDAEQETAINTLNALPKKYTSQLTPYLSSLLDIIPEQSTKQNKKSIANVCKEIFDHMEDERVYDHKENILTIFQTQPDTIKYIFSKPVYRIVRTNPHATINAVSSIKLFANATDKPTKTYIIKTIEILSRYYPNKFKDQLPTLYENIESSFDIENIKYAYKTIVNILTSSEDNTTSDDPYEEKLQAMVKIFERQQLKEVMNIAVNTSHPTIQNEVLNSITKIIQHNHHTIFPILHELQNMEIQEPMPISEHTKYNLIEQKYAFTCLWIATHHPSAYSNPSVKNETIATKIRQLNSRNPIEERYNKNHKTNEFDHLIDTKKTYTELINTIENPNS